MMTVLSGFPLSVATTSNQPSNEALFAERKKFVRMEHRLLI